MSSGHLPPVVASGSMCDDPAGVADWLASHGQRVDGPVTITRVGFGQSNITTVVTDATGQQWVLREPPPGARAHTAHDVEREARIMQCLARSGVPVPTVIGRGTAPTGSSFIVMNRVQGASLETEDEAARLDVGTRRELGQQVILTLARLHTLDPRAVGLADLGPKTPYLERQIRRLSTAWERIGIRSAHDAAWHAVRQTLLDDLPPPNQPTVIIHGDFRLSNLLVSGGCITAVLDWELSTLGDPLADLAWLLDDWRSSEEAAIAMPSPTRAGGFPSRTEMVDIYCRETGFAVDRIAYYRGFSQWRAATLLQGVVVRRQSGVLGSHGDLDLGGLDNSIAELLSSAASDLRTTL